MRNAKWIAAACVAVGMTAQGAAENKSVAPSRAESSVRTVASVAELKAALDAAAKDRAAPRDIRLAAGEYFLTAPILLTPAHSGVTLRGAGADTTKLYGGIPVTGWTKEPDTPFYRAKLPAGRNYEFRTFLKNGAFAPIATLPGGTNRFAHLGEFKVSIMSSLQGGWQRKPTYAERTTMPYRPQDLPDTVDLMNADIRLYHMWSDSLCTVSNVDLKAHTLWTAQPADWAMGACGRNKYEVLNVREGMKEPGQWYLDRKAGVVHYWPLPGEDVAKCRFIAPILPNVIRATGSKWSDDRKYWIRDITIADLSVSAAAPSVRERSSFGGASINAAVSVDHAENAVLENVKISGVGGEGAQFVHTVDSRVAGCDIRDTGALGLAVGCWGSTRTNHGNIIVSNRVSDVGRVYRSACGITMRGSNCVARANEICRIPYSGIIGGGTDNLYERNYIHHVMQTLHDGGAIYGNLTRCTIRGNVAHDIVPFGAGFGVNVYYPDEGSVDCVIENNYSEGAPRPVHCHMTYGTIVRNNTFVNDGDLTLSFQRSVNCAVSNNAIVCGGRLAVGNPDAVPHWRNNFAVRPSDPKNLKARRIVGDWNPERPAQKKKWEKAMTARRTATPPVLDGVFAKDEWPLTWQQLDRTADNHLSGFTGACCRFSWDDRNLYVSLMTSAFQSCQVSLGETWGRDDGVELRFADGRRIRAYLSGKSEIVPQSFAAAGVRLWAGKIPGLKPWENQNRGNYEIAIPWTALGVAPKPGMKIPFNACAYLSSPSLYKYWEGLSRDTDLTGVVFLDAALK